MWLHEGLWQQPLWHLPEPRPQHRQEHAGHADVVAGLALARRLAAGVDGHAARDVADRNLVAVLLDLHLLELDELWPPSLEVQTPTRSKDTE